MNVQQAYNQWAQIYDTNKNKTRDLEALALRKLLQSYTFKNFLEIGCGTGKNTQWLVTKAEKMTAVDLSEQMLRAARNKLTATHVQFVQADILQPWIFTNETYDGIGFSLVLEHVENLHHIFMEAAKRLQPNGLIYIGELHPFKQYRGSKARFETSEGTHVVPCFTHHISEFVNAAKQNGFKITDVNEYFDDADNNDVNNNQTIPRLITFLFEKL